MIVVPVIAAVTAAVLICAPPAFFRTRRSIAPPLSSRFRVPSLKPKNRVRAQAGERLVGKGKLRARLDAGAHGGVVAHFIAEPGWSRCGLRGQKFHVFDYLANARLFELCAVHLREWQAKQEKRDREIFAEEIA